MRAAILDLQAEIERSRRQGRAVAHVRVARGGCGDLLVWASGQSLGNLGAPRLNQRVALYVESLLERGAAGSRLFTKQFETPDGTVEVEVRVWPAEAAAP